MKKNIKNVLFPISFIWDTAKYIQSHFEQGSFYKLNFLFRKIYVITDPKLAEHIAIHNEANYPKSEIYWGQLKKILGNSLGSTEGDQWLYLKRLEQPFFTREQVKNYFPTLCDTNNHFYDKWEKSYKNEWGYDLIEHFSELNLTNTLRVIFGIEDQDKASLLASQIADGEDGINYRTKFPWRPYTAWLSGHNWRIEKYKKFFLSYTKKYVEDRINQNKIPSDMLDALIKESRFFDGNITLQEIRNELIIHLGASTETAGVGIGWTLWLLKKHPDILQKVKDEIQHISLGNGVDPTHIPDLVYTTYCLKEGLRLYPPSHALTRDAIENDTIEGISIKKKETMFISVYGIHRDPRWWNEPNSFIPERFEKEKDFVKYSYLPFGIGKHTCIGRHLALPMMVLAVASFIDRFDYEISTPLPLKPKSLSTLKPNQKIAFKVFSRHIGANKTSNKFTDKSFKV